MTAMTTTHQSSTPFSLVTLPRKQKRLRDWQQALDEEPNHSTIRRPFEITLAAYRSLLWELWEQKAASEGDLEKLASLERELEKFAELVRLAAAKR